MIVAESATKTSADLYRQHAAGAEEGNKEECPVGGRPGNASRIIAVLAKIRAESSDESKRHRLNAPYMAR